MFAVPSLQSNDTLDVERETYGEHNLNARLAVGSPIEEQKEAPRLYSKQLTGPVDVVATQHLDIHEELEAFGRWSREKYQPSTCDSVEKNFDPGEGGRKVRAPIITLPENPRHRAIDQVVRYMRMHLPKHGEALKMYYVGVLPNGKPDPKRPILHAQYIRSSPRAICRTLHLHWSHFGTLMFDSRAAMINLLRRQGS
jgi:hypothetical protein